MALLEEEFQRLQTQFLEMKTSNYNLEDTIKRKDNEMHQLRTKNEELEKELSKLQKVIKFNPFAKKEMKEKEVLNNLQLKIESQEDEFKRTNETLRMEITSLIKTNQLLKNKLIEEGIENIDSLEDVNCYETTDNNLSNSVVPEHDEGDLGQSIDTSASNGHGQHVTTSPMRFAILKEKELLENKVLDLEFKFKSEVKLNESLNHKLEETTLIMESIKSQLTESETLAAQRKDLIDEMKEHIESQAIKSKEEVNQLKFQITAISDQLEDAKKNNETLGKTLLDLKEEITAKDVKISCLVEEKDVLINSLNELKTQIEEISSEAEERLKAANDDHERAMVLLSETTGLQVNELKEKLIKKEEEIELINKQLATLIKKTEDNSDEKKIIEKKGMIKIKELTKQVNVERTRADKLQEKLNQLLNENSVNFNDLEANCDNNLKASSAKDVSSASANDVHETSSSGGSWSFIPGLNKRGHRRNSSLLSGQSGTTKDNEETPTSASPAKDADDDTTSNMSILESENTQLVSRIASLQEEKWVLEEKLNQLIKSMDKLSSEAEDKSKVIQFYCMNGPSSSISSSKMSKSKSSTFSTSFGKSSSSASSADHDKQKMTVGRVVNFIKRGEDEGNLKEINLKLQRMLEETLIKNMHLHQDLERLTSSAVNSSSASFSAAPKDDDFSSSSSTITTSSSKTHN